MHPHSDDFPMIMEVEAGLPQNSPPVAVAFGLNPIRDKAKSEAAGHDVYVDVEFVKIAIPGDRNSLYFQPATEVHKRRFPKAYEAFRQRDSKAIEGMPIENWAPVSRALAMTLKAAHIHTVEALAEVHEGHIDRIGANGRELREKARAWLLDAKEGAAAQQLASEKKQLQDKIDAMQEQIKSLQKLIPKGKAEPAPVVSEQDDTAADIASDVARAARRPRARN